MPTHAPILINKSEFFELILQIKQSVVKQTIKPLQCILMDPHGASHLGWLAELFLLRPNTGLQGILILIRSVASCARSEMVSFLE